MKRTQRIQRTLSLIALSSALSFPALAAGDTAPASGHIPVVREAKRPASLELRPSDADYKGLSGQVVFQLLLAEIALQRGDVNLSSNAYADLAMRTHEPKVFERAVEVAGYARRFDLALDTTRLWLEVEPSSKKAQQMMLSMMILSNQLDDLAPGMVRMLEADKESLAENLLGLNRMLARNPDRQAVFRLIEKVCSPFFATPEAHYSVAMAAGSASENERALAEVRRALELRPDWEMAALLQAQLMMRTSPAEAVSFMQNFLKHNPKARDVQLNLARTLVSEKRYDEARRNFDLLLVDYPDNPDVVYPVAILALQQNDRTLAEAQFTHFLTLPVTDKSIAYYYLGQIAEDKKRSEEALAYYSQVGAGNQYLPAQMRSAQILAEQNMLDAARKKLQQAKFNTPEEHIQLLIAEAALLREAKQTKAAFDLLEKSLAAQPEQSDLLYESALLAEKLGRSDVLEKRLRKLIVLRPDSAQAYNALGYSYAERNQRLPEARELIEKALKLAPEDPFILDSMGWVLYREGDLSGALSVLERVYAMRDDPEIAAHLGEVLWTLGRKDDAQRVLQAAQKKNPNNDELASTVKKLFP